jgi:hypothetical protein
MVVLLAKTKNCSERADSASVPFVLSPLLLLGDDEGKSRREEKRKE